MSELFENENDDNNRITTNDKRSHNIYTILGVSIGNTSIRDINDFYATEPKALVELLKYENFKNVWECACGMGHLSEVLKKYNIHGKSSDLIDRNYGEVEDFLRGETTSWNGDIITNPPFKLANEFITTAINKINVGSKVAMLCRIQLLEGSGRYNNIFRKVPPTRVYIPVKRFNCARGGNFSKFKSNSHSAMMFAWFVWEKQVTYNKKTEMIFCNYI